LPTIDGVMTRARAAGISRLVTISTRVRRRDGLIAILSGFPGSQSVGTHPHHAHEELDIDADELIARSRHPKVVAIGEAGLKPLRQQPARRRGGPRHRRRPETAAAGDPRPRC
jgi:TatD DNase family protein